VKVEEVTSALRSKDSTDSDVQLPHLTSPAHRKERKSWNVHDLDASPEKTSSTVEEVTPHKSKKYKKRSLNGEEKTFSSSQDTVESASETADSTKKSKKRKHSMSYEAEDFIPLQDSPKKSKKRKHGMNYEVEDFIPHQDSPQKSKKRKHGMNYEVEDFKAIQDTSSQDMSSENAASPKKHKKRKRSLSTEETHATSAFECATSAETEVASSPKKKKKKNHRQES
jgi:hypothetical protein